MADFTDSSKRRIAQTVTTWEKQRLSSRQRNRRELSFNSASVLVKTPSGGIPARSGTTLGKADCTIQEIDKSTDGVSDGETISVYNPSATAISGNSYISAIRERTGEFIADVSGGVSSGIVRGTAQTSYTDTSETVDVEVTFSAVKNVFAGDIVTANNYLRLEGDALSRVYVYAHGDADGLAQTFDLIAGECPD